MEVVSSGNKCWINNFLTIGMSSLTGKLIHQATTIPEVSLVMVLPVMAAHKPMKEGTKITNAHDAGA